jgi:two-component system chemotaxis sensor kinase CheA
LMRFEGDEARRLVEIAYGASNYRYRGRWLPIVRLDRLLEQADGGSPEVVNLVVLKAHGRHYGLVVDQVIDNQEIVVKPLWQPLREITVYAGATQLGDVALILDPIGLARRAGLVPELREASPMESRSIEAEAQEPLPRVLVAEGPWGGRIALPIDGLTRIRNVLYSQMTIIEDRLLLEHEGRILQLIDVGSALAAGAAPGCPKAQSRADLAEGRTHVVIYSSQDKSVGLIVGQVLDIVDHASEVRGDPTRSHVQFTTMIDESVVELLDIEGIIRAADPGFFPDPLPVAVGG